MFSDDQTLGRDMVDVHVIEAGTVVRDDAGPPQPSRPVKALGSRLLGADSAAADR